MEISHLRLDYSEDRDAFRIAGNIDLPEPIGQTTIHSDWFPVTAIAIMAAPYRDGEQEDDCPQYVGLSHLYQGEEGIYLARRVAR